MEQSKFTQLLKLGFEPSGRFYVVDGELKMDLTRHTQSKGCYAMVKEGEILYIGITTNKFYSRMMGYKNPGPTQETNKHVKPLIIAKGGVEIYFLPSAYISQFTTTISKEGVAFQVPADMQTIERVLICAFKPEWNRE